MFGSKIYIKERVIYVQIILLRIFLKRENENHKSRLLELGC